MHSIHTEGCLLPASTFGVTHGVPFFINSKLAPSGGPDLPRFELFGGPKVFCSVLALFVFIVMSPISAVACHI